MRVTLIVEDIWGSRVAEYVTESAVPVEVSLAVPGLGDPAWLPLAAKLTEYGQPADNEIAVGPLLRFRAKVEPSP